MCGYAIAYAMDLLAATRNSIVCSQLESSPDGLFALEKENHLKYLFLFIEIV